MGKQQREIIISDVVSKLNHELKKAGWQPPSVRTTNISNGDQFTNHNQKITPAMRLQSLSDDLASTTRLSKPTDYDDRLEDKTSRRPKGPQLKWVHENNGEE